MNTQRVVARIEELKAEYAAEDEFGTFVDTSRMPGDVFEEFDALVTLVKQGDR